MGLYNFQERFVPYILDGSKTHTIRATRRIQEKPGAIMHLYTGLRHKGARLLGRWPCVRVEEIRVEERKLPQSHFLIWIDGQLLDKGECNALAWRDGFRTRGREQSFAEMMDFWAGRLPFQGHVIHWKWPEAPHAHQ